MTTPEADRFHLHRWEVLCSEGRRTIQLELTPAGGEPASVRVESAAVPTASGTECRTTMIDVTAHARVIGALEAELERLDAVLSAVADGMIAFDSDGQIEWTSSGTARLCGCDASELVGRRFDELLGELEQQHETLSLQVRRVDEHSSVALLSLGR
jgi:PAS domain-containing protein